MEVEEPKMNQYLEPMTDAELSAVLRKWERMAAPANLQERVFGRTGRAHGWSWSSMMVHSVRVPVLVVALTVAVVFGLVAMNILGSRVWLATGERMSAPQLLEPTQSVGATPPQAPQVGQTELTPADLTADKSLGSAQAPVTVEIFSDPECPECATMYLQTTRQVIDNYVSSGKVRLVHRDFPLRVHPHSRLAAHWLNAAAAAGLFEPAETALYEKQAVWSSTGKIEEALADAFSASDMQRVRMVESTRGPQLDAAVQNDIELGNLRNVTGTPSIFVFHGGQMTHIPDGSVSYELLKPYLDSLLKQ
jgi:protein-disulfide isomerase